MPRHSDPNVPAATATEQRVAAPPAAPPPWTPERIIGPEAAHAIAARFMPVTTLTPLGAGWDNTAWLVDGTVVFRFPRRRIAVPLLEREIAVLATLAPYVPLPITAPIYSGHDRDGWPFAAYRFLPGRVLALAGTAAMGATPQAEAALARTLGTTLAALHAAPHVDVLGGDVLFKVDARRRLDTTRALAAACDIVIPNHILVDAAAVSHAQRPVVVAHGDLDPRHILVDDDGNPTGIIDWGDVHLGDRATDLALAFAAFAPPARAAFFAAYGVTHCDPETLALARFRAIHVGLGVLSWARDLGDAAMSDYAHRALARALADAD